VTKTATEAYLDSQAQFATLAKAGKAVQDAINMAWEITGWYMGIEQADCPVLALNTNFDTSKMDAGVMVAYVQLVKAGFPKRMALEALQEGGRISEDAELDQLELEWETGLAAERDAQEARMMDMSATGDPLDDSR
jgi:hypothetical protein